MADTTFSATTVLTFMSAVNVGLCIAGLNDNGRYLACIHMIIIMLKRTGIK